MTIIQIVAVCTILAVFFAAFLEVRKKRRENERRQTIRVKEHAFFQAQKRRLDWLKANSLMADSPEHQQLLEDEVRARLTLGESDPRHIFYQSVPALLRECTSKHFMEWADAELQRIELAAIRFLT